MYTKCRASDGVPPTQAALIQQTKGAAYQLIQRHGVATAMRPRTTLRGVLVHPKDKVELAEQRELV